MKDYRRAQPTWREFLVYALSFLMLVGFTFLWAAMGGR